MKSNQIKDKEIQYPVPDYIKEISPRQFVNLANDPKTSVDVLKVLALSDHNGIRILVAKNPNT